MAAQKFIALVGGVFTQISSLVQSAGTSSAGAIPALDGNGRLDVTVMPLGVGPDVQQALAFEALPAGAFVNIYGNAGVLTARLADNSNARPAHGFVRAAFAQGSTAIIYDSVPNDAVSGLLTGERRYLGTAGGTIAVPLDPVLPANTGKIHQYLGVATGTTQLDAELDDHVVL